MEGSDSCSKNLAADSGKVEKDSQLGFTINDVVINNWKAPGTEWWAEVESRPTEPLIEATIKFTLSATEYHRLLDRSKIKGRREQTSYFHVLNY